MMTQLEYVLWWAVLCYFVGSFAGALLWHSSFCIRRDLPGVGDDEKPVTFSASAGGFGGRPCHWDSLCPDVRRVILSKVPLRHLVAAVGVCREFWEEFWRREGEERERLISVAEGTYGKEVVEVFVKSVQDGIYRLDPYTGDFMEEGHYLVIGAVGKPKVVPYEVVEKLLQNSCVAVFARHNHSFGRHILMTNRKTGGRYEMVEIGLRVWGTCRMQLEASITQGTGEAEMGILLAICERSQEEVRFRMCSRWAKSPNTVPATIQGPKIREKFQGPLGDLNDTFYMYTL